MSILALPPSLLRSLALLLCQGSSLSRHNLRVIKRVLPIFAEVIAMASTDECGNLLVSDVLPVAHVPDDGALVRLWDGFVRKRS
ncbi:uncharacterized protein B0H18DRAFT_1014131 [Fomitopsis serialis]|uniref:uncharacterized protein n=1 Tax=Fomitopsis serialis TaxID=139415 RepID=UPI002007724A|nr:uncharacterized protein B0H18DRAFT_1014131 [Neoantrodia serialis]KAH9923596.1 hypothetical protein B0H18DRAFT_1014131 [Neoantrodia serialis]